MQPRFPMEDLSKDNTAVLKYTLEHAAGLKAYSKELEDKQRYIYLIANRAIRLLGLPAQDTLPAFYAFSNGFAGFETISDLVHPARAYDITLANTRVTQFFIDPRSLFDINVDREIFAPAEQAAQSNGQVEEDETVELDGGGMFRMPLTPAMEEALTGKPTVQLITTGHDRPHPEEAFTKRHGILPEQYPNTYDVIVAMGEVRHETMGQLQMRVAGAGLARTLQTRD